MLSLTPAHRGICTPVAYTHTDTDIEIKNLIFKKKPMIHLFLKLSIDTLTLQLIKSNSKQTGKTVSIAHLIPELCPVRGESAP